jgi:hypothetical protein
MCLFAKQSATYKRWGDQAQPRPSGDGVTLEVIAGFMLADAPVALATLLRKL